MELTEHEPADVIETSETPLWFFANHPEPQACLDKNRDCEVGIDDWWQFVYENKHDEWREIGLDVPTEAMQFSGFWSQGDGASFYECAIDWEKFWPQLKADYPLLERYEADLPQPKLYSRGNYCHEYSVGIELYSVDWIDEELQAKGEDPKVIDNEWNALADGLASTLREKMRDLYAALEEEYDYLTSDDLLREKFTDESYMFEADGTIHYV